MKRKGLVLIVSLGILVLLNSCISLEANQIETNERTEIEVLGYVTKSWLSPSFASKSSLENKAISELKKEAQRKGFKGNIDIRNVRVAGSFHIFSIFFGLFQNITASGDVVLYNSVTGRNNANAKGVEGALARAAEQTLKNVPPRSRIAIVYITAQDRSTTEYVVGELEYMWVNEGYFIIDRSQLDQLRSEQKFGMSGEVDDKTATSIGRIAGASVIVTGRVDGDGDLSRLRLRALDSETAQVIGVASERLQ